MKHTYDILCTYKRVLGTNCFYSLSTYSTTSKARDKRHLLPIKVDKVRL